MAKRKATAGDLGCLAAILLVAVLAVLGPLALACWCLFAEIRALAYRGVRSLDDVLSSEEKRELENAERIVEALDAKISQTLQRGLASGFAQRADGMFDARRPQARAMNAVLDTLYTQRTNAVYSSEEVMRRLCGRMNAWLAARSGLIGARAAIVAFVICFIGIVAATGGRLNLSALLFGDVTGSGSRLGGSLGAMTIAILVLLVAQSVAKKSLAA